MAGDPNERRAVGDPRAAGGVARVVRTDFPVGYVHDPAELIKHGNDSVFNS